MKVIRGLRSAAFAIAAVLLVVLLSAVLLLPSLVSIGAVIAAAAATYWLTEKSRRDERRRQRAEDRYSGLLRALPGILERGGDVADTKAFIAEWYQMWLYCPDHIVRTAGDLMDALRERPGSDERREAALGVLMVAIRREVQGRTELSAADFRLLAATRAAPREPREPS